MRKAATKFDLGIAAVAVREPEDLGGAVERAASGRPDALIVIHDVLTVGYRAQIARLALKHRLPTISASTSFVARGGPASRTAPARRASSSGRPSSWTGFFAGQSPPTFQSNSRSRFELGGQPQDRQGARPHNPARRCSRGRMRSSSKCVDERSSWAPSALAFARRSPPRRSSHRRRWPAIGYPPRPGPSHVARGVPARAP